MTAPPLGVAVPATILSLALLGDALIYVVLPLHAAEFGVTIAWVGVLLSANRIIRIFTYGIIADAVRRAGARWLTIAATIGAVVSTAVYGLATGGPALLAARILWGLSFGVLSLTSLSYAVSVAGAAGRRVGMSRAITSLGPVFALSVGAWAVSHLGPQGVFVALAVVSALAVPLALSLDDLPRGENTPGARFIPVPTSVDIFAFAMAFCVDGIFVMTLSVLLAGSISVESAVLAGGLLLALRFVVEFLTAPLGGTLGDRHGAARMTVICGIGLAIGFALIAADWTRAGAAVIVVMRGLLQTLSPVLAAERRPADHLAGLSAYATWRDIGAAIGPLAAGFLAASLDQRTLYVGLALLLAAALGLLAVDRQRRD